MLYRPNSLRLLRKSRNVRWMNGPHGEIGSCQPAGEFPFNISSNTRGTHLRPPCDGFLENSQPPPTLYRIQWRCPLHSDKRRSRSTKRKHSSSRLILSCHNSHIHSHINRHSSHTSTHNSNHRDLTGCHRPTKHSRCLGRTFPPKFLQFFEWNVTLYCHLNFL